MINRRTCTSPTRELRIDMVTAALLSGFLLSPNGYFDLRGSYLWFYNVCEARCASVPHRVT